jgi:hypothetical protein
MSELEFEDEAASGEFSEGKCYCHFTFLISYWLPLIGQPETVGNI